MAEESELHIYTEIGPDWMGMTSDRAVIAALDQLSASGVKKIHVRINSPGGDAFMGISIKEAFRRSNAKIIAHVDALAASAASIIAMGADKIIMHEGSLMMIHRAWTFGMGNAEDFAKIGDTLSKVDQNLIDIYQRKTGLDKAKVKQLVDDETWMKPAEAVAMGFADEADGIVPNARASLPQGWYTKAPQAIYRYAIAASIRKPPALIAPRTSNHSDAARKARMESLRSKLAA